MRREIRAKKWAVMTFLRERKEPVGFNDLYKTFRGASQWTTIKNRSTLSNCLKQLQNEDCVRRDPNSRKYFLTEKGTKLAETLGISFLLLEASPEIRELSFRTLEAINNESKGLDQHSDKEIVEALSSWIGALGLHSLLEQIKKGEPFIVVAFYYLGYIGAAYAAMKRHIVYQDPEIRNGDIEILPELSTRMDLRTGLEKYDVYKPIIKQFEKAIASRFPDQTRLLKQLFEGKQDGNQI